jgi:hypothetical protein
MKSHGESARAHGADGQTLIRDQFKFSTYNVRTLSETGKFHQLCSGCLNYKLDFVAVQEHRWKTDLELDTQQSTTGEYTFIFSSATVRGQGGVGLLILQKHMRLLSSSQKVSARILRADFNYSPNLTIFCAYAPTEDASMADKALFYEELEKAVRSVPSHNVILVGGDFNARIGLDSHLSSPRVIGANAYHDDTTPNGDLLVTSCEALNLRPAQHRFPQPKGRQWTWSHPSGSRAQIDHILIRAKWLNSLRNCRSYATVELDSDHRIVTATVKLSLRATKPKPTTKRLDWHTLCHDAVIQQQYNVQVHNKFQNLYWSENLSSAQERYDVFAQCIEQAAKETIPILARNRRPWVSRCSEEANKQREKAKAAFQKHRTDENYLTWRQRATESRDSFIKDKNNYYENLCTQATEAAKANNSKELYKIIRTIASKKQKSNTHLVKMRDGSSPKNKDDLLAEWRSYFADLLNNPSTTSSNIRIHASSTDLPINSDDFTILEVRNAIRKLKNGKSPGDDVYITGEALKHAESTAEVLMEICNDVLNSNNPPRQWLTNTIIPIPKKGNLCQMQNYRGISLLSVAAKVYNTLILNRLYPEVNARLRLNQAGFRRGMNCVEQIHVIRRLLEGARDKHLPIIVTFIDFCKAFDSIDRVAMWKILRSYGIPEKLVNAIKCIYTNSKSRVRINTDLSEEFSVTTGVLQGDTLAPFLFIIVLDYVMRGIPTGFGFKTHSQPDVVLEDLDFADDIGLLDETIEQAQNHVESLAAGASSVGLKLNIDKTKFLALPRQASDIILADGSRIQQVEDFKYLGSMINSALTDINIRRGMAWGAFWDMSKIWKSADIPLTLKVRIFNATCLSVLLYGCETWPLTKQICARLDSFATSCFRYMLNIKRTDHVTNTFVLSAVGQPSLSTLVKQRQLRWLGHTLRRTDNSYIRQFALYTPSHGKRQRGRPPLTYKKYIEQLIKNITTEDIETVAQDRDRWRQLVVDCSAAE